MGGDINRLDARDSVICFRTATHEKRESSDSRVCVAQNLVDRIICLLLLRHLVSNRRAQFAGELKMVIAE